MEPPKANSYKRSHANDPEAQRSATKTTPDRDVEDLMDLTVDWPADSKHMGAWIRHMNFSYTSGGLFVFMTGSKVATLHQAGGEEVDAIRTNLIRNAQLTADYYFLPVPSFIDDTMLHRHATHWSLLVVDRQCKRAHHYDTTAWNAGENTARVLAQKMGRILQAELAFQPVRTGPTSMTSSDSDCGVVTCALMKHLTHMLMERHGREMVEAGQRRGLIIGGMPCQRRIARHVIRATIAQLHQGHWGRRT